MPLDPILAETRALREQYAAQFNHDPVAIFADIMRQRAADNRPRVSFPPRKPQIPVLQ